MIKPFSLLFLFLASVSLARGPGGTGGGDRYTQDFIRIAKMYIYPWLKENGTKLKPTVDAELFLNSINPPKIMSQHQVYESCDGTKTGREVEACYNADSKFTYISRTKYPLEGDNNHSKIRIVAHEVLRAMTLAEGDAYSLSIQIALQAVIIRTEYIQPDWTLKYDFVSRSWVKKQNPIIKTIRRDITSDGRVIFSLCKASYFKYTGKLDVIKDCELKGRPEGYAISYVDKVFNEFDKYFKAEHLKTVFNTSAGGVGGAGVGAGVWTVLGSNPYTGLALGAAAGLVLGFKLLEFKPNTGAINIKMIRTKSEVYPISENLVVIRSDSNMTLIDGLDKLIEILNANYQLQ